VKNPFLVLGLAIGLAAPNAAIAGHGGGLRIQGVCVAR